MLEIQLAGEYLRWILASLNIHGKVEVTADEIIQLLIRCLGNVALISISNLLIYCDIPSVIIVCILYDIHN